jgi:8-oxo-dGTP pyrophosphatase MutT (NUDIX family)
MPDLLTAELIRERLARAADRPAENLFPPGYFQQQPQPAAVLIPFFYFDERWNVLFIRRTDGINDRHGGQVAFPGGRADKNDQNLETTALRESLEEISLAPSDVEILGQLSPVITNSNFVVTPFVAVIPWPYPLVLDPGEVARAFSIPLPWLINPANARREFRKVPGFSETVEVIYFRYYAGELLWGVSAKIVRNLLLALDLSQP